jgi:uncharacterized protein (TIGR02266 family)
MREMTVPCSSGISESFIEQPGTDVSLGGMFIETQRPSPRGTHLKFEVRLPGHRVPVQGVGRVLWIREGPASDADHPPGMSVELVELDDDAKHVIGRLLEGQGKQPLPRQ